MSKSCRFVRLQSARAPDSFATLLHFVSSARRNLAKASGDGLIDVSTPWASSRRTPSEELMLRIAQVYGLPVARLRAGWSRAESSVTEAATSSETSGRELLEPSP